MVLNGRAVLITGASRGIGYATAEAFLRAGASVAFCATDEGRVARATSRLARLGPVEGWVADVRDAREVAHFVDAARKRFGALHALVNNAGRAWTGPFAEQDRAIIDEEIDVNVKGVLYTTRAVLPAMIAQRDGVVVNVASGAGKSGFAELATYCASKFAVVGFTESLAREVAGAGVDVYAVCPGSVDTDMLRGLGYTGGIAAARVAEKIVGLCARRPTRRGACLDID